MLSAECRAGHSNGACPRGVTANRRDLACRSSNRRDRVFRSANRRDLVCRSCENVVLGRVLALGKGTNLTGREDPPRVCVLLIFLKWPGGQIGPSTSRRHLRVPYGRCIGYWPLRGYGLCPVSTSYRGTSLIRNTPLLGPYSSTV